LEAQEKAQAFEAQYKQKHTLFYLSPYLTCFHFASTKLAYLFNEGGLAGGLGDALGFEAQEMP